jgi:DNA-binding SARP family transcriptional activator/tetratricopeptide (TPR) repeat protein
MTLHRQVAEAAEGHDWRLACHHYAQIGDEAGIIRTIDDAVEEILARGDVLVAEGYLTGLHEQEAITSHEVIRSRSELKRGDHQRALQRARAARRSDPESVVAVLNMALVAYHAGDYELTETVARDVLSMSAGPTQKAMAAGLLGMIEASVDGDLNASLAALEELRGMQQARGYVHHEATTLLNIAVYQKVKGNPEAVLTACDEAIPRLTDDPDGTVLACVMTARGWAQAALGDLSTARLSFSKAIADVNDAGKPEAMLEAAETEIWLGSADRAREYLRDSEPLLKLNPGIADLFMANQAQLAIRSEDPADSSWIRRFRIGERSLLVGNKSHQLAVVANHAVSNRTGAAEAAVQSALGQAQRQSAGLWIDYCRLLLAILHGPESLKGELRRLARTRPYVIGMLAEHVVDNLSALGEEGDDVLVPEMQRRPERWLPSLRQALDRGTPASLASSRFLEAIGTAEDVGRLRQAGRKHKSAIASDLGKRLAKRVAHRVYVEDQGRVALRVGGHHVEGASVRRKVLALLCYLLTRPRFAANRDEVLEALWPDFEPAVALNSLNQTLYFLRRVVEPGYREDTSPDYVRHDSDVVWLDRQLVSSRSQVCADFIRSLPAQPSPEQVQKLAEMYHGQFALDFAYEEWAVGYRESTHASYLQVVENALALDIATGHFDRGVLLARRALNVDPNAEQIELSLVRLLRMSGAHAAAAEQYAHYSSVLETLGLEAPPLDAL